MRYGAQQLKGGSSQYGYLAGVLCLSSMIPRPVGDPGHAQTFEYPMVHQVVEGLTFKQLLDRDESSLDKILQAAKTLEAKGVRFITTSCGLYAPFQKRIAEQLCVPFISSALHAVPFLQSLLPVGKCIGVLTGHAGLLQDEHLVASGYRLADVRVQGMEGYPEFRRVVLEGAQDMNLESMRREAAEAACTLVQENADVAMLVLECPNLIPFRADIQASAQRPVYDIVNLAGWIASGFFFQEFAPRYL